jgi:P27 family predicted phage terminase small subunit
LKVLEGNRGRRPILRTPSPPIVAPDPPAFLQPYALEKWSEVAPSLVAVELLSNLDGAVLAAFCEAYGRFRLATEKLADAAKADPASASLLVTMPSGAVVQNPLIGIANAAAKLMVSYAAELGMTPSARAGIELADRDFDDAIARKYFG